MRLYKILGRNSPDWDKDYENEEESHPEEAFPADNVIKIGLRKK